MILQLLNVLIGLTLVYLIFSTMASAIFELLEGLIRQRGRLLAKGITEILRELSANPGADLRRFYDHPLISSLFEGNFAPDARTLPSYIPPERFARAVLMLAEDAAGTANAASDPFVRLRDFAERLIGQRVLAQGESYAQALESEIVDHFNASMDRVSGWFTRYARKVLLGIGIALAIFANIDTIQILRTLSMDPLLADRIAESAAQYVEERTKPSDTENGGRDPSAAGQSNGAAVDSLQPGTEAAAHVDSDSTSASTRQPASVAANAGTADNGDGGFSNQLQVVKQNRQLAESLGLPLGWQDGEFRHTLAVQSNLGDTVKKIIGLLLTGLALSFGAPFWFDLLNQLVNLRSTLKPEKKAPTAAGETADKSGPSTPK